MPPSIPVSATAEAALALPDGRPPGRRILRTVLSRPRGAVGALIVGLLLGIGVAAPVLAPSDPFRITGPSLSPPTGEHPMGTDALGRDLLSGVIVGTRSASVVVASVGALVLVIGLVIGTLAGYAGRWVDDVLMRVTEFVQVLPRFFLIIVIVAMWGPERHKLIIALGITSWPILARVVRAEVLSLSRRDFVDAARAGGSSGLRIVTRELLPNLLPVTMTYVGLVVAQGLLLEASLGYLGLADQNVMTWGILAGQAQRFLRVAWWLALFPGAAIAVTVVGLNLLADSLADAISGRR